MAVREFSEAIDALRDNFAIEIAPDEALIHQAYELRHQVYCLERGFLTGDRGIEMDAFDVRSRHIVLLCRQTSEVMGTVRLVLSDPTNLDNSFPVQHVCPLPALFRIPLHSTAEVSRFAISKQRRPGFGAFMRLGLMQGMVTLSSKLGLTHWCAVMEPALLRLLQGMGIRFHPFGPIVDYHGPRQPCFNRIDLLLQRIHDECPSVWDMLTDGGRLYPMDREPALVAA
jgi:N-acyl-L-homoserine lactone synthetase